MTTNQGDFNTGYGARTTATGRGVNWGWLGLLGLSWSRWNARKKQGRGTRSSLIGYRDKQKRSQRWLLFKKDPPSSAQVKQETNIFIW